MTSVGVMASAVNVSTGPVYAFHLDSTDAASFTFTATPPQVATWKDKSAAARTGTVTNPGTTCVRSGTINGLTTVTFSGSISQLGFTDIDPTVMVAANGTDCMMFAVVTLTDTTRAMLHQHGATSSPRLSLDLRTACRWDVGNDSTARLAGTITYATATPYLYAAYRSGATMKVFRNGAELLTRSDASGTMASNPLADIEIATAGSFRGNIGEMIIVAGYDAAQFTSIRTTLGTKWGVTP